ncbi:beta-galactosidase, partial [Erysipelothrix rhusiopathiae]|nr:beta-galactosidase [Erysipelothrix rhusiopathiae]
KQANKKGLAVTEIEVYDRIAKAHQDFTVTLKVDGKDVDAFTQDHNFVYEQKTNNLPSLELQATNNANITAIEIENGMKYVVRAEDGIKTETYTITYDTSIRDARNALVKMISKAKNVDIEGYESLGVQAMQTSILKAQTAVEDLNTDVKTLQSLTKLLEKNIDDLVAVGDQIDKARESLKAMIDIAESIDRTLYTDESLAALDKQLSFAKVSYEDDSATTVILDLD